MSSSSYQKLIPAFSNSSENGIIYFGSIGPDSYGRVYALNNDGSEKWHYDTGNWIYSTPAIEEETIYITSNDKYLYALSSTDGSLLWRFRAGDSLSSPSINDDGIIYFSSHDDYLYAIYPNGTIQWRTEIDSGSSDTPGIGSDGTIYIGGFYFYAVNPDGSIKWIYQGWEPYEYECTSRTYAISSEGIIYFVATKHGGWGGDLIALNHDGTLRWRKNIATNDYQYSSPVIDLQGNVYIGSIYVDSGYLFGDLFAFSNVENNSPPDKPDINAPSSSRVREEQNYTFIVNDANDDEVYLWVDWGDGTNTSWIGPYNSGEEIILQHTWNLRGSYIISAKAKDMHDVEGEWQSLEVRMPKQNQINNNITIEIIGIIGVTIEIHNNGNDIIPLINHTITVDSPFLFLGYSVSSNYSELMPGTSLSVWTGVIGFGVLSVIVSIDDLIKSRDGYIFGPFVIFKIINSIGDNNER